MTPTPLTAARNWNLWYGHYDPTRSLLSPASPSTVKNFLDAISTPVRDESGGLRLLNAMAEALPSLEFAKDLIQSEIVELEVADVRDPMIFAGNNDRDVFLLPIERNPIYFLASLITTLGSLTPLAGIRAVFPQMRHAPSYRERFWRSYRWSVAVGKTILFQTALEMAQRKIPLSLGGMEMGLLRAVDLALFLHLREDGLAGLMEGIMTYLEPELRSGLERGIDETIASLERQGHAKAPVESWDVPPRAEKPTLPRTFIDDQAEKRSSWGSGLFTQESTGAVPSEARVREIGKILKRPVEGPAEIELMISLIRELAPDLARKILSPYEEGLLKVKVVMRDAGEKVNVETPISFLFDVPLRQPLELGVSRGTSIEAVLVDFVGDLARYYPPEEALQTSRLRAPFGDDRDRILIASFLDHRWRVRSAWSTGAMLEFVNQAAAKGIRLFLGPVGQKMKETLVKFGLGMLIDHYHSLMDESEYSRHKSICLIYTDALFQSGELENLVAFLEGRATAESLAGFEHNFRKALDRVSVRLPEDLDITSARTSLEIERERIETVQKAIERGRRVVNTLGSLPKAVREGDGKVTLIGKRLGEVIGEMERLSPRSQAAYRLASALLDHLTPPPGSGRKVSLSSSLANLLLKEPRPSLQNLATQLKELTVRKDLLADLFDRTAAIREQQRDEKRRERARTGEHQQGRATQVAAARRELDAGRAAAAAEAEGARRRRIEEEALEQALQAEADALRAEEGRRRANESVLHHRQSELNDLIGRLEMTLVELAVRGVIAESVLEPPGPDTLEVTIGNETKMLSLRPSLEKRSQEIWRRFKEAKGRPFTERDATKGFPEQMIALCDEVRSCFSWLSRGHS